MTTLFIDPPVSSTEVPSVEAIDAAQSQSVPADVSAPTREPVATGLDRVVTMTRSAIGGVAGVLRQFKNAPIVPCADMWFPNLLVAELQKQQTSRGAVADGIVGACE